MDNEVVDMQTRIKKGACTLLDIYFTSHTFHIIVTCSNCNLITYSLCVKKQQESSVISYRKCDAEWIKGDVLTSMKNRDNALREVRRSKKDTD